MHTFAVAEVEPCTDPLSPEPEALDRRLVAKGTNVAGALTWPTNAFVGAADLAFNEHRPLALAPDDVWLTIAQGFAAHVTANAEALRGRFVRHRGKETLRVERDDLITDDSGAAWGATIDELSDQIAARIGKKRDLVVCDFSTTGRVERLASEVVLLGAMKDYFEYRAVSRCGIPSVTLLGSPADWSAIRRRAEVLTEYGLDFWTRRLLPLLDEVARASGGSPDRELWRSFYKENGSSGGPYVSGWIHAFFPYLQKTTPAPSRGSKRQLVSDSLHKNPFLDLAEDRRRIMLGPKHNELPGGLLRVPLVWERTDLGREIAMELAGGFAGVAQDAQTGAVRPAIGWSVRKAGR